MIDTAKLLDMVMGATGGSVPATLDRRNEAFGPREPAQAGGGGGAGDLLDTARSFLGSQAGGLAGGAAAGALAGLLLGTKSGRRMAGTVVKVGGAAALGALAYKAYSNYRDGKPVAAGIPGADLLTGGASQVALPGAPPASEHALLLLRAMIAAALSDGVIDASERELILGRLDAAGINREEHAFLEREIASPLAPRDFAAAATTPEMRSELYLASALAIEADTAAERAYLAYLAATLGLEAKLVAHLEEAVASAKGEAAGIAQRAAG